MQVGCKSNYKANLYHTHNNNAEDKRLIGEVAELHVVKKTLANSDSAIIALHELGFSISRREFAKTIIDRLNLFLKFLQGLCYLSASSAETPEVRSEKVIKLLIEAFGDEVPPNTEVILESPLEKIIDKLIKDKLRLLFLLHGEDKLLSCLDENLLGKFFQEETFEKLMIITNLIFDLEVSYLDHIKSLYGNSLSPECLIARHEKELAKNNYWISKEDMDLFLSINGYFFKESSEGQYHYYLNADTSNRLILYTSKLGYFGKLNWQSVKSVQSAQKYEDCFNSYFLRQRPIPQNIFISPVLSSQDQPIWQLNLNNVNKKFVLFTAINNDNLYIYAPLIDYLKTFGVLDKLEKVLGVSAGAVIGFLVSINLDRSKVYDFLLKLSESNDKIDSTKFRLYLVGAVYNHLKDSVKKVREELKQIILERKSDPQLLNDYCKILSYCNELDTMKHKNFHFNFEILHIFRKFYPDKFKDLVILAEDSNTKSRLSFSNTATPKLDIIDAVITAQFTRFTSKVNLSSVNSQLFDNLAHEANTLLFSLSLNLFSEDYGNTINLEEIFNSNAKSQLANFEFLKQRVRKRMDEFFSFDQLSFTDSNLKNLLARLSNQELQLLIQSDESFEVILAAAEVIHLRENLSKDLYTF